MRGTFKGNIGVVEGFYKGFYRGYMRVIWGFGISYDVENLFGVSQNEGYL